MAISRLPPLLVAMGSAVYAGYLAALDESLYRTPSAGFEGRMAVLFALNGLVIVLGIAYLVLLTLEYRRKGRAWWWFRLVQRPSGRYIASNQGAFAALLGIVSTVVIIGHLREEFNLYLYKSPQNHIAAWRSYSWIPLFVNGWIVSWASLQSYLLTPDQHNRTLLSATVANSLYVGGGVAMTVALFIGSGFSSIAGNDVWRKYVDLRTLLLGLESGSTPPSSSDTLALSSGYQDLLSAAERYRTASIALGILLAVSPFLTVLVNTGSLGLARVLRKQIKRSLRTFRRPSATDSIVPHLSTKNEADGMLRPDDMGTVPSRAEIRQIATLQASGFEGEQAKKIMLLQRAEMDLTVVGGLIFSLSLLFGIITIWIEVRVDSNTLNGASWPTIETALFLVEWIYAIVLSVALLFLIYNAYNHLAATSTVETVQSVFVGASNSIASFQGMFRRQDIPESSATSSHFPGPTRGNPFPTNFSNSRRSGGGGGNNAFPPPPSSSSFARFDSAKSMNQGRMLKVEEGNEMDKVNFEQNFSTSPRPSLT